ncbi:MAG: helix-turn-helix domain-containing protein [Epulopiscium sp.]|nr:helix-turn-helix domain-containing protein [Candidatus Epulonipiscium sp.]
MTYHMLIAEDELDEYQLVLYLLKQFNLDSLFRIISHASNGKQALSIIEDTPIDLLLTDIEMPFANGLQIATRLREKNSDLPIIFFSCYDNFSYVKTALSVHACNYLLKPLDPMEFQKTMLQVIELLRESEANKKSLESRSIAIKNHYLYLTLNRMPFPDFSSLEAEYDFSFINHYSRILLFHFEEPFFDCDAMVSDKFIENLHKIFQVPFDFLNLDASQSILLLKDSVEHTTSNLIDTCQKVQARIYELYDTKCYIAISSQLTTNYLLADAYEDMSSLIETRFFSRDQYVFIKESPQNNMADKYDFCSELLAEIETDINTNNIKKLAHDVTRLNHSFEQCKSVSHIYVRFIYSKLMQLLYKNQNQEELMKDIEKIFSCTSIYEIKKVVTTALSKLQKVDSSKVKNTKHAIQLVKQYIAAHYNEDITLNKLADVVYLNASYLSTIFKAETGSGINKYIKTVRMEKAKQMLLQTNMKISDICTAVGFRNNSYFIKSFHEYYGETPEKMRQKS